MEDLRAHAHRVRHAGGTNRLDHEFLDVDRIVGMAAAIDDVHRRHRQRASIGAADVAGTAACRHSAAAALATASADREDRVGSKTRLVRSAVEIDHDLVDADLLAGIDTADRFENFALDIGDRLAHAFAAIARRIAVAQFHRFIGAGGGAGRHRGAAGGTAFQDHIAFDGGIAAAVEDFAGDDVGDGTHDGGSGVLRARLRSTGWGVAATLVPACGWRSARGRWSSRTVGSA